MSNAQASQILSLQSAATANGNGTTVDVEGANGAIQIEIAETAGGTCTVALKGSFDGANFYAVGYQQVDASATLTRAVTAISVLANTRHVYQILDPYPEYQAVIASVAGGATVSVKMYAVQV